MNLVPMRFKGVEWHHNPRELTFENEYKTPAGKAPSSEVRASCTARIAPSSFRGFFPC